jgi:hypothetical protein
MSDAGSALDGRFAARLDTLVDNDLLMYRDLVAWAQETASELDAPPAWLVKVAAASWKGEAQQALRAASAPLADQEWPSTDVDIACLYLRHARRELSWATFLRESGKLADATPGRDDCEFFYDMLNDHEIAGFLLDVEREQVTRVEHGYRDVIELVRSEYESLDVPRPQRS